MAFDAYKLSIMSLIYYILHAQIFQGVPVLPFRPARACVSAKHRRYLVHSEPARHARAKVLHLDRRHSNLFRQRFRHGSPMYDRERKQSAFIVYQKLVR